MSRLPMRLGMKGDDFDQVPPQTKLSEEARLFEGMVGSVSPQSILEPLVTFSLAEDIYRGTRGHSCQSRRLRIINAKSELDIATTATDTL